MAMSEATRVTTVYLPGLESRGAPIEPAAVTLIAGLGPMGAFELRETLDRLDTIDLGSADISFGGLGSGTSVHAESRHGILGIAGPRRRIPMIESRSLIERLAASSAGPGSTLDAAVSVLERRLAQARSEHDDASTELAAVSTDLRAERQFLDSFASATYQQARQTLAEIEMELGVEPGTDTIASSDVIESRLASAQQQLGDLRRRLARHAPAAVARVRQASAYVREVLGDALLQSTDAPALADELVAAQAAMATLEARVAGHGPSADEMTARLEEARRQLAEVERQSRGHKVDTEDVAALEEAHDIVQAAEHKASGRLPSPRAKRALEEARVVEQEILDRLGFPTWSAFMMESTNYGVSRDAKRDLSQAIISRDDAEQAWYEFQTRLEAEPDFEPTLERLARAHDTAVALVGPVEDLDHALRTHRVDLNQVKSFDAEAGAEELAHALGDVGAISADIAVVDPSMLLSRADAWLDDLARSTQNRPALELERGRIEVEIRNLQSLAVRQSADGAADVLDVRLADARSAVASARGRLDRHRAAVRRIASLTQRSEELAQAIAERAEVMASVADLVAVTAMTSGRRAAPPASTQVRTMVAELCGIDLPRSRRPARPPLGRRGRRPRPRRDHQRRHRAPGGHAGSRGERCPRDGGLRRLHRWQVGHGGDRRHLTKSTIVATLLP